jgi:hypothetical protein
MVSQTMNSIFRHYSLRIWTTAILGAVICMLVLPWWTKFWGLDGLLLPVLAILVLVFAGLGALMNRVGHFFLVRQFKELAVWERAGLGPEARSAYEQAAALFDSFWLSPRKRAASYQWAGSRVARFLLSDSRISARWRLALAGFLMRCPEDATIADAWLAHQLKLKQRLPEEHEAASRIGDALIDHSRIQWRLFQIYLNDRRTDFDALQIYQRVVRQEDASASTEVLHRLARLLHDALQLNDWCLSIYLQAYETGEMVCLEGIAAAARWLPENADNGPMLQKARMLVTDLSSERLESLTRRFKKGGHHTVNHQRLSVPRAAATRNLRRLVAKLLSLVLKGAIRIVSVARHMTALKPPSAVQKVWGAGLLCVLLVIAVMIWQPWHSGVEDGTPLESPPSVKALDPIVTDPFTIQVAAYLKSEDAKRYVQELKQKELDAFWTKATSAKRTWYQVKVSHFPTKAQAQQYGDQLKSKGLIDDFYVANYQRTE